MGNGYLLIKDSLRSCVMAVAVMTTACVPLSETFYKPVDPANDASIVGCAVPHVLTFSRQGVKFTLTTHLSQEDVVSRGGMLATELSLVVPRGTTVTFDVNKLRAVNGAGERIGGITAKGSDGVWVRDWTQMNRPPIKLAPPPETFSADGMTDSRGRAWYSIDFSVRLSNPTPPIFFIVIPKMQVGGRRYAPLRIKFRKTSGIYLVPINGC